MADYYPLISRAVAGLERNTGENRRALYERARAALLAQLRGVTPALSESDITRERLALEESIRKVEAEAARAYVEPMRPGKPRPTEPPREDVAPLRGRPSDPRAWGDDSEPQAPPPRRYVNPPAEGGGAQRRPRPAPASLSELRRSDAPPERAPREAPAQPPPSPPRHPLRRPAPAPDRSPAGQASLREFRNAVSDAHELGAASAKAEKSAREAYARMPSPAAEPERPARSYDRAQERAEPRLFEHPPEERAFGPRGAPPESFTQPMLEPAIGFDEAPPAPTKSRRAAPPAEAEDVYQPAEEPVRPPRSYRGLAKIAVATVMLIALGAGLAWQRSNLIALYQRVVRSPPAEVAREAPPAPPSKKIQERVEASQQQATAPTAPEGAQLAAVAQKVVLYEEDPADPNGKRFVGSAIWRTETVTPGPGQPPELAIRADVEVPERKLAMTWSLRRNTDKGLPASHTVEIIFKVPGDFPAGGITNVPGILMKPAETTKGAPLRGLAVKVTSGYFLIGLSNTENDKEYNLQMLKERNWFDIPVVYDNNRRAILAVEKGTPGERVFAEAFKTWKQ